MAIDLTEALLVLSRADRQAFAREPVDLSLIADDAVETLIPLAEAHGATVESAGEPAAAVGSPALLLQLTANLVHNAIVHNESAGGTIWVTTDAVARGASADVEIRPERGRFPLEPLRLPGLTVLEIHRHAGFAFVDLGARDGLELGGREGPPSNLG